MARQIRKGEEGRGAREKRRDRGICMVGTASALGLAIITSIEQWFRDPIQRVMNGSGQGTPLYPILGTFLRMDLERSFA